MARILIIEDKGSLRAMLVKLLRPTHDVESAASGAQGLAQLAAGCFDLVLSDIKLPDAGGMAILAHCQADHPHTEVILMTAFATIGAAVDAVKAGAYDYLPKPFEPDDLLLRVDRALERGALLARARAAEAALRQHELDGAREMLGESPAMKRVRRLMDRVASLDVSVLITGESGTGKEVLAHAIHESSERRARPFVAVNCGAIPGPLLESELFGHKRGGFTGAHADREGLIESAADGTLFLDEIGDLPLDVQVKLNRALEERRYRRLGETRERPVEARIIAATHRDLQGLVKSGGFREDLYFRLEVYPIELPPLRARGEDVFLLAQYFLEAARARFGSSVRDFSPEALRALAEYGWPGNVRELAHAVERAVILADGEVLQAGDLPRLVEPDRPGAGATSPSLEPAFADLDYREAMEQARVRAGRRYLDALLRAHRGNVTRAAEHAGVERESLHRLARKVGLNPADYRR